ncbi:MAG TPA: low temperature requirement protein A [Kofleriaceae bacterium]|nr:low temperature requirement protein A [Kofleriaceae bacterium]
MTRPEPEADTSGAAPARSGELERRVTVLELFFDLVFVFAITQVTGLLAADLTLAGLGRGAILVAALWWAWAAYSWLTNTLDAEDPAPRVTVLAAMAAMLIVSLAVPRAFGADAVPFAAAYLVVRVLHVLLYYLAVRGDRALRRGVVRLAPLFLIGSALLLCAAFASGAARAGLWVVALCIDYSGPLMAGPSGWRVHAGHFVERHGLIVLIALGEAIVSIGVGAAGLALEPLLLCAALLAVVVAGALWWAYFDLVAIEAELRLGRASGSEQVALARDGYTYLHLPLVAGVVFAALGVKKALSHADLSLDRVSSIALFGGVALYFAGHVLFRLRVVGSLGRPRLLLVLALVGAAAAGTRLPALASLALVAALCTALVAWETVVYRDWRSRLRRERDDHSRSSTA